MISLWWTLERYVDDIQDLCIEEGIRNNGGDEVSEIAKVYIDNVYFKDGLETMSKEDIFDEIMQEIDYGYINDAIYESKHTNLQALGLSESDFL